MGMKKEYILAGGTIMLWGMMPPFTKLLLSGLSNAKTVFISSMIAFIFMAVLNLACGNLKRFLQYRPKDYVKMIALGFMGKFLYSVLYFYGLSGLAAGDACIINYLWPVMTVVFSCLWLGERFTWRKSMAIFASFSGVVLVASKGSMEGLLSGNLRGIVSCVAAAVFYGAFNVLNKKENRDQFVSMTVYFFSAALFSGIWFLAEGESIALTGAQTAGIIWLGVFMDAAAFLMWALALQNGDTAKLSNFAYITPFMAVLYSALLLNEPVDRYSVIGLLLIMGGIFVQMGGSERGASLFKRKRIA